MHWRYHSLALIHPFRVHCMGGGGGGGVLVKLLLLYCLLMRYAALSRERNCVFQVPAGDGEIHQIGTGNDRIYGVELLKYLITIRPLWIQGYKATLDSRVECYLGYIGKSHKATLDMWGNATTCDKATLDIGKFHKATLDIGGNATRLPWTYGGMSQGYPGYRGIPQGYPGYMGECHKATLDIWGNPTRLPLIYEGMPQGNPGSRDWNAARYPGMMRGLVVWNREHFCVTIATNSHQDSC